jgi:hypothetical protein
MTMVHRDVQDKGHELTIIIWVSHMVKETYFYCLALGPIVICDESTIYKWVTITALLVAWVTRDQTRSGC